MSIVRKFVNNFTTGEISPGVQQRLDLQKYAAACQRVENAVVLPHGGVAKRHGFQTCAELPACAWLVPFQYSAGDSSVLAFLDQKVQVYVGGELQTINALVNGSYTNQTWFACGFEIEDLPEVKFVQSGDALFMAHRDYQPRKITRSIATVNDTPVVRWLSSAMKFRTSVKRPNTPTASDNNSGTQVSTILSNSTGVSNREISYVVSAVDDNGEESLPSNAMTVKVKTSWPQGGVITITWNMPSGHTAVSYNVYKKIRGQYGRIGSTTSQIFYDDNIEPDLSKAPKSEYNPFDTDDGGNNLPGSVSIYQQRLVFGSTNNQKQTVFMTETGIWKSFGKHEPLIDSDSIEVTMDSRQMNEIRHIVILKDGVVFTNGAEYVMSPGRNNDAITPTSIRFDLQSYFGCSNVPPLVVGKSILFIERDGRVVRDFMYNYSEDGYTGSDLTIMASHLLNVPIRDWAYQQSPNNCVWVILEDGTLLSFTYMKEQEIYAWARHSSKYGLFRSVTVVHEGIYDIAYFVVERCGHYYLERLESQWEYGLPVEESVFLDASVYFERAANAVTDTETTISDSSLSALADICAANPNESPVVAVIDGSVFTGLRVESGNTPSITLPRTGQDMVIGLPYKMTVETVDPEISSQDGAIVADKRSVAEVAVAVRETADLKIGYDEQHLETLKFPYPANLGDAPVLYTGYLKAPLAGSYRPTASMVMTSDSPLPCTILSLMSKISIG